MLEKIVKFAKISPQSIITCGLGIGAIALSITDGFQEIDLLTYLIGGAATAWGIRNGIAEYKLYNKVVELIKNGAVFSKHEDPNLRRYSKIYEDEQRRK